MRSQYAIIENHMMLYFVDHATINLYVGINTIFCPFLSRAINAVIRHLLVKLSAHTALSKKAINAVIRHLLEKLSAHTALSNSRYCSYSVLQNQTMHSSKNLY